MGVESINVPKAPANWQPSADQQRQIQSDPRMRNMSRDDLYFIFNKPKVPSQGQPQGRAQPQAQPKPRTQQQGGAGSFLDGFYAIIEALRGANR